VASRAGKENGLANTESRPGSTGSAGSSSFERRQLAEARRKRGTMNFLERMEADSDCKQAFGQVCDMRQNDQQRKALDKMIVNGRPQPETTGPKVVTHSGKNLFQGHDKKMEWGPLEFY